MSYFNNTRNLVDHPYFYNSEILNQVLMYIYLRSLTNTVASRLIHVTAKYDNAAWAKHYE